VKGTQATLSVRNLQYGKAVTINLLSLEPRFVAFLSLHDLYKSVCPAANQPQPWIPREENSGYDNGRNTTKTNKLGRRKDEKVKVREKERRREMALIE